MTTKQTPIGPELRSFCAALGCRTELIRARKPFCRVHWRMVSPHIQSSILAYSGEKTRDYWHWMKQAIVEVAEVEGVTLSEYALHIQKLQDGREVLVHYQDFHGFPCNGIFHVHDGGYEKIAESELYGRTVHIERLGETPAPMAAAALMPFRETMVEALNRHAEMKILEFNVKGQACWPSLNEWSQLVVDTALDELQKENKS